MTLCQLIEVDDDSLGLPLPQELLERHGWAVGDTLFLTETETGFLISPRDPADALPNPRAP